MRLASPQSREHFVDAELLYFFNRFFAQWMSMQDFDALASSKWPRSVIRVSKGLSGLEFVAKISASPLKTALRLPDS
jgi:hypothetical protein